MTDKTEIFGTDDDMGRIIEAMWRLMTDKTETFGLAWMFGLAWAAYAPADAPQPVREYRFHPERRWRFDFAWPSYRMAVEVDGGQWMARGGRHNRDADREKLNAAACDGWRVIRLTPQMREERGSYWVAEIVRALRECQK